MAIDGIKTTEICSNQSAAGTTSADAKKPANSIMEVANQGNTSVEEKKNTSKLDELLEKMCAECAEFSKYGLKASEIKNSGILYRISGMNEKQFENADESKIKQVLDCLKTAIKDSIVDGKIDIEKAGKLGNKYYIALSTGWSSIEKYKENQSGESLSARMERFFGLDKKGIKFAELPEAKIKEYLQRYFKEFFVEKLKAAKTPQAKKNILRQQLQDFGKLLNNTPDSEKAVFKQVITSLLADNRIKGLDATLASFDTQAARTEWANSWSTKDYEEFATTPDIEGNVPVQKDVTAGVAKISAQKSEDNLTATHKELNDEATKFFTENKEALGKIDEKIAKGEVLTEEEKALKLKRDNYFVAVSAGEISGTAINTVINEEAKKAILDTMNKDAHKLPIYRDVVKQVNEFVEEHPEALTIPKEELVKLLDEVTNGNYSAIAQNPSAELKAPREEKAGTTEIVNTKSKEEFEAAQARLAAKTNEIYNNSVVQQPQFTVEPVVENAAQATEKAGDTKLTASEVYTLKNQALQSAVNISEYLKQTGESKFGFATEAFKKFGEIGTTTQNWAMNYFSNASSCVQQLFLGKIANSYTGMLAAAKEVDLSKFNIIGMGIVTEKAVEKVQEQRGLV